jgi:4-aminobutyrate aminotransferase-like enzyme
LLLGLEVHGADAAAAKARTRAIVNTLASRARILIGSEGPAGSILKIRPPLPFRPEHADRLAAAIGAAAAAIDPQVPSIFSNSGTIWNRSPTRP